MSAASTKPAVTQVLYDLEATVLAVCATSPALLEGMDYFIGERRMTSPRQPTFGLHIDYGAPRPLPDEAEILYHGPLPGEGLCVFGRMKDAYMLSFPGAATLTVNPERRTADIVLAENGLRHIHGGMIALVLEFALDADGQQVVHCAGLSLPHSDRAMLFCAPSGTGKTTTALALARFGFPLAGDDAMVLSRRGDQFCAWGLPRAAKIHRKSVELLSWLASVTGERWDDADEQAVTREKLAEIIPIDRRCLRVTDMVLLRRGDGIEIMLQPIHKAEMLAALAADNVRLAATGITPLQSRRYSMLAGAVSKASTFELTTTRNLEALAGAIQIMRRREPVR